MHGCACVVCRGIHGGMRMIKHCGSVRTKHAVHACRAASAAACSTSPTRPGWWRSASCWARCSVVRRTRRCVSLMPAGDAPAPGWRQAVGSLLPLMQAMADLCRHNQHEYVLNIDFHCKLNIAVQSKFAGSSGRRTRRGAGLAVGNRARDGSRRCAPVPAGPGSALAGADYSCLTCRSSCRYISCMHAPGAGCRDRFHA